MSRPILFVVVGVLWCARSLQSLTDPAYTDPGNVWDWLAVVSFSAALFALAVALPAFAQLVGGQLVFVVSLVPAAGAMIAGIGNLLEDGAQLEWAGDWLYLPSVTLFVLGLIALTVTIAAAGRGRARLLAAVPALTLVGGLLEAGGAVLVLAAWLAAASMAVRAQRAPSTRP